MVVFCTVFFPPFPQVPFWLAAKVKTNSLINESELETIKSVHSGHHTISYGITFAFAAHLKEMKSQQLLCSYHRSTALLDMASAAQMMFQECQISRVSSFRKFSLANNSIWYETKTAHTLILILTLCHLQLFTWVWVNWKFWRVKKGDECSWSYCWTVSYSGSKAATRGEHGNTSPLCLHHVFPPVSTVQEWEGKEILSLFLFQQMSRAGEAQG